MIYHKRLIAKISGLDGQFNYEALVYWMFNIKMLLRYSLGMWLAFPMYPREERAEFLAFQCC